MTCLQGHLLPLPVCEERNQGQDDRQAHEPGFLQDNESHSTANRSKGGCDVYCRPKPLQPLAVVRIRLLQPYSLELRVC